MESIPITIRSDDKGYFDRECPNEKCLFTFKILMKDWKEKVSDDEVHCPLCGYVDTSEKWWTQNQLEQLNPLVYGYAVEYIQDSLEKAFGEIARSTRHNKYIQVKYKPGVRVSFTNNPIGQCEEWETEICCEKCGTHYSVIGSAYFCPCCGYNSAVSSFIDSLDSISKMIDSLKDMKLMLTEKYDVDSAESMCRKLLESSVGDMISAFQKFACCIYEELTGQHARVNDFQIVDKGSQLFKDAIGKEYSNWLSIDELASMRVLFQKRHLLEHNNGIVDQKYIDTSQDMSYSVGQRIVVKENDAYELLAVLRKLGNEIIKLKAGEKKSGN